MWNGVIGPVFPIYCGVRQGGILSSLLFSVYIDDLLNESAYVCQDMVHILAVYLPEQLLTLMIIVFIMFMLWASENVRHQILFCIWREMGHMF